MEDFSEIRSPCRAISPDRPMSFLPSFGLAAGRPIRPRRLSRHSPEPFRAAGHHNSNPLLLNLRRQQSGIIHYEHMMVSVHYRDQSGDPRVWYRRWHGQIEGPPYPRGYPLNVLRHGRVQQHLQPDIRLDRVTEGEDCPQICAPTSLITSAPWAWLATTSTASNATAMNPANVMMNLQTRLSVSRHSTQNE
jgi:hypothetical protein